ncbi:MAG: glycosyltransferase family 1 protein [Pedosphaera sp.]|nr:glycosyltransferase family 1 protein [Pedosphaera sp.]
MLPLYLLKPHPALDQTRELFHRGLPTPGDHPLTSGPPMQIKVPLEPRRLLFVDHVSKVLGGAEVNLVELLGLPAARERWQVAVACAPGSALGAALEKIGVRCFTYGLAPVLNELRVVGQSFQPLAKLRGWRELRNAETRLGEILSEFRPDAVISCTNKDHFAAGAAARAGGIPSLWWVNDLMTRDFFSWAVRKVFVRRAESTATRLLPVSDAARRALLDGGVSPARITTIFNGIPLDRYQASSSRLLREQLRLTDREPLFGIVGRITAWKGQDLFVQIARQWSEAGRAGHFAIIGRAFNEDAPFEATLKEEIRRAKLGNRVSFVPFQSDIVTALSSLDVLLHCSIRPEPFGRVIIEAMAVGVPVIAARAGGVPEIITENVDGSMLSPGHVPDYVQELNTLMTVPGRRESWIRAGRKKVAGRFTLDRVFRDFDRVLDEVVPR